MGGQKISISMFSTSSKKEDISAHFIPSRFLEHLHINFLYWGCFLIMDLPTNSHLINNPHQESSRNHEIFGFGPTFQSIPTIRCPSIICLTRRATSWTLDPIKLIQGYKCFGLQFQAYVEWNVIDKVARANTMKWGKWIVLSDLSFPSVSHYSKLIVKQLLS